MNRIKGPFYPYELFNFNSIWGGEGRTWQEWLCSKCSLTLPYYDPQKQISNCFECTRRTPREKVRFQGKISRHWDSLSLFFSLRVFWTVCRQTTVNEREEPKLYVGGRSESSLRKVYGTEVKRHKLYPDHRPRTSVHSLLQNILSTKTRLLRGGVCDSGGIFRRLLCNEYR